ncbi:MAG: PqiC family protein [Albidovulum sp.]
MMRLLGLKRICVAAFMLGLVGCGSGNDARFLMDPPAPAQQFKLRVGRIELREVSLPAYAASPEIAMQDESGALRNLPDALWADDPVRGMTSALARSLDEASDAVVAAEPWPLDAPADLRIEVRIDRMLARADGQFELSGQYAYYAPSGAGRGVLERFAISVPVQTEGTGGVAAAAGTATSALAAEILTRLSR